MKLATKMIAGFLSIGALGFVVGLFGVVSLSSVETSLENVAKVNLVSVASLGDILLGQKEVDSAENALLVPNLPDADVAANLKRFEEAQKTIETAWKIYEPLPQTDEEARIWRNELVPAWQAWMKDHETYKAMAQRYHGTPKEQRTESAYQELVKQALDTNGKTFTKAEALLNRVVDINSEESEKATKRALSSAALQKGLMVALVMVGLVLSGAIGFFLSRSIAQALRRISERLSVASDETAAAAEQLSAAAQRLAEGATEQASSLQETSATVEELNAMTHKAADNAKTTSDVVGSNRESAGEGKKAVNNVLQAMNSIESSNTDIMNQVKDSNEKIGEIVKIINDIGNRTKVINEIVFQTKLLSFNASVEAARAGEHGKGFAVVAEEVGNLAQMSGNAAKEIEAMLAGSVSRVEGIVSETKSKVEALISEGKLRLDEGKRMVDNCNTVLEEIVAGSTKATHMANEVSQGAEQQSQGINEITSAISQLDQVTQENASTAEESASSAERLSEQALELRSAVSALVEVIDGNSTMAPGAHRETTPRRAAPSVNSGHEAHATKNVISIKRKPGRVLPTATPGATGTEPADGFKKAVGFDGAPSDKDPRFKEI